MALTFRTRRLLQTSCNWWKFKSYYCKHFCCRSICRYIACANLVLPRRKSQNSCLDWCNNLRPLDDWLKKSCAWSKWLQIYIRRWCLTNNSPRTELCLQSPFPSFNVPYQHLLQWLLTVPFLAYEQPAEYFEPINLYNPHPRDSIDAKWHAQHRETRRSAKISEERGTIEDE